MRIFFNQSIDRLLDAMTKDEIRVAFVTDVIPDAFNLFRYRIRKAFADCGKWELYYDNVIGFENGSRVCFYTALQKRKIEGCQFHRVYIGPDVRALTHDVLALTIFPVLTLHQGDVYIVEGKTYI